VIQDHLTCEDADKQEEAEEEITENRLSFFMLFKTRSGKKIHPGVRCVGRHKSDRQ
jgi:hypothetical protein